MLLDVRREEVMNMEINLQQGNTIVTVIGQENLGEDMLGAKLMLINEGSEKKGALSWPGSKGKQNN